MHQKLGFEVAIDDLEAAADRIAGMAYADPLITEIQLQRRGGLIEEGLDTTVIRIHCLAELPVIARQISRRD